MAVKEKNRAAEEDEEFKQQMKPKKSNAKGQNEQGIQNGKPKKKKGKKGIIFMVLLILIAGGVAALYFTGTLSSLLGLEPDEATMTMEQWQAQLGSKESDLTIWSGVLTDKEAELNKRESELDEREAALLKAESANLTFSQRIAGKTEDELADIQKVSNIYAKMDAAAAAEALLEIKDEDRTAMIIYYMQPNASAPILAEMTAEQAAEITAVIMK